jgi:uncharacterized protein (DUF1330 family)
LFEGEKMPAYLIGHIAVRDPALWSIYVEGVKKSLRPFQADVLFRGRLTSVLAGELPYDRSVVIRFPDDATLQDWYRSEDYHALVPIRDRAAEVVIAAYEEMP